MTVKISIIVPVYNIEAFLPNCIESLIRQSFPDIEIILVNDGSSDNSPKICDEYASRDKRIKVIHKPNEGVSAARNTGLEAAQGEYIAFVDGDDWVYHDIYQIMHNAIYATNADLIMCGYTRVFPNGESETANEPLQEGAYVNEEIFHKLILPMIGNTFTDLSSNLIMGSIWRCLYKKTIIEKYKIEFPIIKIAEDMLFHLTYLSKCKKVYFLDQALYYYRFNSSSATKNYITSLWETLLQQLVLVEQNLHEFNLLNDLSKERLQTNTLYFLSWCITNECHPKSPKTYRQAIRTMKQIALHPKTKQAFKWKNILYAPLKERIIFICIKIRLFSLVYFYHRRKLIGIS